MDEILGAFFALLVGMMYLPKIENGIATARQTQTDVTTAQQQTQWASAVGNYASQNMATLEASATATTPVTLSVATVQAANVGLPSNFSSTNPFNQTWTAKVLQPTDGTLQVLAYGSGGNVISDQELGQIARAAGGSGGFIPTNNSGAYAGGPATAYGTFGGWKIATAGYSVGSGGAPATLLTFTNGALSSNYLYRNAVPGQPQLNEMNTALGMNGNNVTNVGQLQANSGNGVQIGSSYYYGDGTNSAIRQNGALYVQNQAGTAAAPINSGTASISGDVDTSGNANISGNVTAGGSVTVNGGNVNMNGGGIYNSSTQYIETTNGNNLYLKPWNSGGMTVVGGGGGSGQLLATGNITSQQYLIPQGGASAGGGCSPNGAIGTDGQQTLFCKSGVWSAAGAFGTTWYQMGNTSGVNYQNTTGHPIEVVVTVNCTAGGGVPGEGTLYSWASGQSPVEVADTYGECGYQDRIPLAAVIPSNNFYAVLTTTMAVSNWAELR